MPKSTDHRKRKMNLWMYRPTPTSPTINVPQSYSLGGGWTGGSPRQFEQHVNTSSPAKWSDHADYRVPRATRPRSRLSPRRQVSIAGSASNDTRLGTTRPPRGGGGGFLRRTPGAAYSARSRLDDPGRNLRPVQPQRAVLFNPRSSSAPIGAAVRRIRYPPPFAWAPPPNRSSVPPHPLKALRPLTSTATPTARSRSRQAQRSPQKREAGNLCSSKATKARPGLFNFAGVECIFS